ncbi:MAG TPA: BMP family ABC transporter substrate-binding protein [Spirochaetaceae bacterium]|nr:BMP family ABC transporter substrate-binding protein [Spirochaetaceae bacterium]
MHEKPKLNASAGGISMKRVLFLSVAAVIALSISCAKPAEAPNRLSVALFVPGVASGSPIYEMLVSGAQKAVAESPGATIKVIEGGYDQSAWLDKLRDIAASGEFGLIVSSNPAIPELCAKVAEDYPEQRFFIADAYLDGHPAMHTVLYNQIEQGYIVGYLAGLVSKAARPAGPLIAGLISAQRYPTFDRLIEPGFVAGLKAVDPGFSVEYREIGNWYDANKAAELARSLYAAGAELILPIAGGAGQGVVAVAAELKKKVVLFDGSGYRLGPDAVIGCATIAQDRLVYERLKALLAGDKLYGKADIVSARESYVGFDADGPAYKALPQAIRSAFEQALTELAQGRPDFTLTSF